jgi:hypothetical protein
LKMRLHESAVYHERYAKIQHREDDLT